ncbi:hypothetical protein GIB67_014749 [Kingdonia uniflora]|uniref:Uncharacterized protein n=1 Tax=Kingdonia uniflora TaxID=39325 RepID=A0A7J7NVB5_9MAGN|nr:hypothetical protein GIB67_014749 [Kingdonia uniflora]
MPRNERDWYALIESKNQLEEELTMNKGNKATVEGTEDVAKKLKDKEKECDDLKKHVSELDETRQANAKLEAALETLTKTKGIFKEELGAGRRRGKS